MHIILIGGAQRSGTTLLQTLLANALGNAPVLPECHILFDLLCAYHKAASSDWPKTSHYYSTKDELTAFFRSTVERHLGDLRARYESAEQIVLKNPNLARVLGEAKDLLPDARRVVCVRDPRDIVASYVKIGHRQAARDMVTNYTKRNLDFICRKIMTSYRSLLAAPTSDDIAVISYERLVTDPKQELRRVVAGTQLPLRVDSIEKARWLDAESRHVAETWITELEGGPPTPKSVGGFRTLLSDEEVGFVEQYCRELMDEFGYVPTFSGEPPFSGKPHSSHR